MLDILTLIFLVIMGIIFGIIATLVGIGGGLLNVPFLIFLFKFQPATATLTSSVIIVFTSISGFLKYRSLNRIDYKTAIIYLALAIPGSFLGGYVAEIINEQLIKRLFAVLIGIAAIRGIGKAYLTRNSKDYTPNNLSDLPEDENNNHETKKFSRFTNTKRRIIDSEGDVFEYEAKLSIGVIFAFAGGFVAGLLGVGGGIIFVPLLGAISGIPIHIAVATSTTMIVVVSIIAVFTRFSVASAGSYNLTTILSFSIPLAIGSIIGAYIGAAKVKQISSKRLKLFFWMIALLAAIRMFIT